MDNIKLSISEIAQYIDHTALKPITTLQDIHKLCEEANEYGFYSVCVNPCYVKVANDFLKDAQTIPITVVGFPLGANSTLMKCKETELAIHDGAKEIDMVIHIGAAKANDLKTLQNDIREVVRASANIPVKVILETCYFNNAEITELSRIAKDTGAHFVKTSTGFGSAGAKVEHIQIMRNTVGENFGVKASGGIRDLKSFMNMVEAGANRIGCSASVNIIKEFSALSDN